MVQLKRDLGALRKGELIGGLLYLPMFFMGTQVLASLILDALASALRWDSTHGMLNLIFQILNVAALGLIFRHYLKDQLRRLQNRGWALFPDLLLGWLIRYGLSYVASMLVTMLSVTLSQGYSNANQEAFEASTAISPLLSILCACVLAPFSEELLFRGLFFCGLYRRSRFLAYAVSMLAFSLAHVLGFIFSQPLTLTVMNLLVYLPYGFALGWIYERSGSVWSAVFLHALTNATTMLLLNLIH